MKQLLSIAALTATVALVTCPPALAKDHTTTVHFAHGATTATLKGSVKGYDTANFLLGATGGQVMAVTFQPNNASCYINVVGPGGGEAIFNGSAEGNSFKGTLSADGTYTIQAYLMRNEARRGKTCNYTVRISLDGGTDQGGKSATVSDEHMRGECKGAAAGFYGVRPVYISLDNNGYVFPASDGFSVAGTADKGGEGIKHFTCIFDESRRLKEVMPGDSDGE